MISAEKKGWFGGVYHDNCFNSSNASEPTFDFGRKTGHVLALTVNLQDMFIISLIVVAVSVIAGFQPAYRASRMNPIDALRHV